MPEPTDPRPRRWLLTLAWQEPGQPTAIRSRVATGPSPAAILAYLWRAMPGAAIGLLRAEEVDEETARELDEAAGPWELADDAGD